MNSFTDDATSTQIDSAITAGGFASVALCIVAPDPNYPTGSATVVLVNSTTGDSAGYRIGKTFAKTGTGSAGAFLTSLVTTYSLQSKASGYVDDGNGVIYTGAQVAAGWS